jgi:predicted dehydrogenase
MTALRVAVVGAGVMGRLHARAIARRAKAVGDCSLEYVIDRHRDRSDRVAAEFGGRAAAPPHADWSAIDAAVIAIPTRGHAVLTKELLDLGLDILLEKPMALTVREAQELADLAEQTGRILQVGHTEWYNSGWRAALKHAGQPNLIEVERLNPKTDRGLDIDVVQDFVLHDLDWVTRIMGEDVESLEAHGRAVDHSSLDEAEVHLRFASGCVVQLRASRVHSERRRIVRVEGRDATAEADLISGRLIRVDLTSIKGRPDSGGETSDVAEPLDAQWSDFIRACRERKAPANDARVGVAAVALVERVRGAIGIASEGARDADDPAIRG